MLGMPFFCCLLHCNGLSTVRARSVILQAISVVGSAANESLVFSNVFYKRVCNTSECATLPNFGGAARKN